MPPAFIELAAVLVLSSILGILARFFRQPLVVAYILAGFIISILGIFKQFDQNVFDLFSNLGIAFLLFLVGMELKLVDLKYVGRAALYTGLGQIVFTALVGFVIASAMGFGAVASIYIAVALTFSSTVIIVKLLSEKHDLQSLHGKIAVGFLLVQDFVAILALMILSGFGGGHGIGVADVLLILVKGLVLVALAYLAGRFLLKYLFRLTSVSGELLFVSALAWAFIFAVAGVALGFSVAIGAFLAGLAVASSPYSLQISARVKPLRDFFIIIFFIVLGASLSLGASEVLVSHVVILSLFILVGNPLILLAIMKTMGFRNRTAFLTSVTTAQVSEFSLILMTVGLALGHVTGQAVALVAAVAMVTITASSYLILYGDKIYQMLSRAMARFLPDPPADPYVLASQKLSGHMIVVGAEQMGWDILEFLSKKAKKENILVVDFNPEVIKAVTAGGFTAVFGDIGDPEVLEQLELGKASLVVVTDPNLSDNMALIKFAKENGFAGPIIVSCYWLHDAIKLYEAGAHYVVVPEEVGGDQVAGVLEANWGDFSKIKKAKNRNFDRLLSRRIF